MLSRGILEVLVAAGCSANHALAFCSIFFFFTHSIASAYLVGWAGISFASGFSSYFTPPVKCMLRGGIST